MNVTIKFPSRPPIPLPMKMLWHGLAGTVKRQKKPRTHDMEIRQDEIRAWMIGHSTVLINFFGTTILTDPVFITWLPLPKRHAAAGFVPQELPRIDYVIISHAHIDHFNRRSLRKVSPKVETIVVPRNCGDLVPEKKFKTVLELDWNQHYRSNDVVITVYRPIHWGERYPWQRKQRGYNSYLLQKNGRSIFFCGDSAYGDFFKLIGRHYQPDVALLPIGAYAPRSLRAVHMNPTDALQAFDDLGAEHFIPIHWGSFRLSLETLEEPPRLLHHLASQNGWRDRVHILRNGESIAFT